MKTTIPDMFYFIMSRDCTVVVTVLNWMWFRLRYNFNFSQLPLKIGWYNDVNTYVMFNNLLTSHILL